MHIAAQPVELCDEDRAFRLAGMRERRGQLRATVERIRAFAGLDLDMLANHLDTLGLGEAPDGGSLRFDTESALALAGGADTVVSDCAGHGNESSSRLRIHYTTVLYLSKTFDWSLVSVSNAVSRQKSVSATAARVRLRCSLQV